MNTAETLLALWDDIHTGTRAARNSNHTRDHYTHTETRPLTEDEWKTVREAIQSGCPATIFSHGYGFLSSLACSSVAANQYPGNALNKNRDDQGLRCSADGGHT